MKQILILLLKFYKFFLSPVIVSVFGQACRFTPSCSEYTIEAIKKHGAIQGSFLGAKRLSRCHPFNFHAKIYDPVP